MQLKQTILNRIEEMMSHFGAGAGVGAIYHLWQHPDTSGDDAIDSDSLFAYLHYYDCRYAGTSPRLAEMFALAKPPQ